MIQFGKRRSFLLLVVLIFCWTVATILTACGIYLSFHKSRRLLMVDRKQDWFSLEINHMDKSKSSDASSDIHNTLHGHLLLACGCLLNVLFLAAMSIFIIREKMLAKAHLNLVLEQPPQYENLVKEETPPPTYSQVDLTAISSSSSDSSTSTSPSSSSSTSSFNNPCYTSNSIWKPVTSSSLAITHI